MRRKIFVAGAVATAALLAASAAYAAVTVSFSASVSPSKAGKPTGLKVTSFRAIPPRSSRRS